MIKCVFLFPNGNVVCTDEAGQQVVAWQAPLLVDHLRRMQEAGVVDGSTQIETASGTFTLAQFLSSITCPTCGRTSFNANDVRERYCGACHQWHSDMV